MRIGELSCGHAPGGTEIATRLGCHMIKSWFYRDFKPYAEKVGVKLLRDDFKFIERTICNLPEGTQREACRRYIEEWKLGMARNAPRNQNSGRYRANNYLQDFTGRIR